VFASLMRTPEWLRRLAGPYPGSTTGNSGSDDATDVVHSSRPLVCHCWV